MNLKRHHVLYALLAICLIVGIFVLLTPGARLSFIASKTPQMLSTGLKTGISSRTPSILPMQFEVVTTQAAQERGLGGRTDVPENYGMLFVFPKDEKVGFWMKDMIVPIDIIWLSDEGTILGVLDTLSSSTYPQVFYPPQPVKYVLETRAGETRRRGWSIGTNVGLPQPYGPAH